MMASNSLEFAEDEDLGKRFTIKVLQLGKAFTHTPPSWPIFSLDLRLMKFTLGLDDQPSRDQPMLYDGFIRDDSALFDLPKPFELTIMDIPDHSFVKSEVSYDIFSIASALYLGIASMEGASPFSCADHFMNSG